MLETKEQIRELILDNLSSYNGICKLSGVTKKCKSESMLFNTLNEMVTNKEVETDGNFIWLPKKKQN